MCNYCSGEEVKIYPDLRYMDDIFKIKDGFLLIEGSAACSNGDGANYEIDIKIQYCPNCGRKL